MIESPLWIICTQVVLQGKLGGLLELGFLQRKGYRLGQEPLNKGHAQVVFSRELLYSKGIVQKQHKSLLF
jgi:hypothetical protein